MKQQSVKNSQTSVFRTNKGSIYFVHDDGTTTRVKAKRPEHQDSGLQPRSVKTVYLTKENTARLAPPQATWRVVDNFDGTLSLVVLRDGVWRASNSSSRVLYETKPRVGLIPLELWQPEVYVQAHFGNAITEIH